MRISDWSSDVCSSDLPSSRQPLPDGRLFGGNLTHPIDAQLLEQRLVPGVACVGRGQQLLTEKDRVRAGKEAQSLQFFRHGFPAGRKTDEQIGRASGREREGQYV